MDEAIARLQRPGADFDVFFATIDVLPDLIGAKLLRPLNHDYLPNVVNLWSWFRERTALLRPGPRVFRPVYGLFERGGLA